jgi:hypothetical protein
MKSCPCSVNDPRLTARRSRAVRRAFAPAEDGVNQQDDDRDLLARDLSRRIEEDPSRPDR